MKDSLGTPMELNARVICYAHAYHGTGTIIGFVPENGRVIVKTDTGGEMKISRIDIEVKTR